jgi:surface antigen
MRTVQRLFAIALAVAVLSTAGSQALAGDNWCCNQNSTGNPYLCYSTGNCVWWAWKMAKDNWGDPLPMRRSARYWADDARLNGYIVSSEPAPNTIAVNTTYTDRYGNRYGHVAWVQSVSGNYVYVSEMQYGSSICRVIYNKQYSKQFFDGGFIYEKPGRPRIDGIYPSPYWSLYNQDYGVYGQNFSTSNLRVRVTFPNGGSTIISGEQLPYQSWNYFTMRVLIGSSGMWAIQVINNDKRESNTFWFYVY